MTLGKHVLRNITRRRGRFVFTLRGITIGIASFVTFLSLGGSLKAEIVEILHTLHRRGKTIVLVTHNDGIARQAQNVIRVQDGLICS